MNVLFSANPIGVSNALRHKKILIAGCGGLGSNVAMMLVRAGANLLYLVDFDCVSEGNLNRQFFFYDQIASPKVEALSINLKRINPNITLILKNEKLNMQQDFSQYDIIIECFDQATYKAQLLELMLSKFPNVFYIGCSGLAGIHSLEKIKVKSLTRKSCIIGDFQSDLKEGVVASRVMAAACLQAHAAICYLLEEKTCNTSS